MRALPQRLVACAGRVDQARLRPPHTPPPRSGAEASAEPATARDGSDHGRGRGLSRKPRPVSVVPAASGSRCHVVPGGHVEARCAARVELGEPRRESERRLAEAQLRQQDDENGVLCGRRRAAAVRGWRRCRAARGRLLRDHNPQCEGAPAREAGALPLPIALDGADDRLWLGVHGGGRLRQRRPLLRHSPWQAASRAVVRRVH